MRSQTTAVDSLSLSPLVLMSLRIGIADPATRELPARPIGSVPQQASE